MHKTPTSLWSHMRFERVLPGTNAEIGMTFSKVQSFKAGCVLNAFLVSPFRTELHFAVVWSIYAKMLFEQDQKTAIF